MHTRPKEERDKIARQFQKIIEVIPELVTDLKYYAKSGRAFDRLVAYVSRLLYVLHINNVLNNFIDQRQSCRWTKG
jgi:hypothetical protein